MKIKNLDFWDISMVKLSVFSATLFLVSVWDGFSGWVRSTHWAWFLVIALLLAVKPLVTVFRK